MKYKVGDKVKIKTWDRMEKEYGIRENGNINCKKSFLPNMEEELNKLNTNRILTIKEINNNHYYMKEIGYYWSDDMIECLAEDYKIEILEPINSRWEILDL